MWLLSLGYYCPLIPNVYSGKRNAWVYSIDLHSGKYLLNKVVYLPRLVKQSYLTIHVSSALSLIVCKMPWTLLFNMTITKSQRRRTLYICKLLRAFPDSIFHQRTRAGSVSGTLLLLLLLLLLLYCKSCGDAAELKLASHCDRTDEKELWYVCCLGLSPACKQLPIF